MDEMTVTTRIEAFLARIVNGSGEIPEPETDTELYLAAICGESVTLPEPDSRFTTFLARILGENVALPVPQTRAEMYLAKICGEDVTVPVPLTRLDAWLALWAESGGGTETTVTGVAPITLSSAISHAILSLTQTGKCTQASTPTPDAPVDIYCNNGAIKYVALGANLFDSSPSAILLNYYRNSTTGVLTQSNPNFITAGYIPVKPNTSYVLVGRAKSDNTISAWNRIYWFDANKEFISTSSYTQDKATIAVSPANAAFAQYAINYNNSPTNVVTRAEVDSYNYTFCEGTAEPATFVPFVGGVKAVGTPETLTVTDADSNTQTASVEDLLSVGPAADTQEIIGGDVERAITKFRVTSDMTWQLASGTGYKQFYSTDTQGVLANSKSCMSNIAEYGCTASNRTNYSYGCYTGGTGNLCFQMVGANDINTVDDWKAFLDENIVYVIAERATTVTEHVTPQPLTTAQGTNTASVSSNVDPVTLSCRYMAAS